MLIAPGIAALEIKAAVRGEMRSVFPTLLWDDEHAVLVDTGYPGQTYLLRAALAEAGVPDERLTEILLTHHDIDHIGCAAELLAASAGRLDVLAHRIEAPYVDGTLRPLKLTMMETNLEKLPPPMKAIYESIKAGFQGRAVPVSRTLEDGEVLPFAGGVEVIFTPGHTLGHVSLYHVPSRTLISGDAVGLENGAPAIPPPFLNHDTQACARSLARLAEYDVITLICYHGGVMQGNAQDRLKELASSIVQT